jgi:penicillin amidase/acyl-homoserine-lactone acylase
VVTVNGLVTSLTDGAPSGEALAKQLATTIESFKEHFGRIDPTWGEVNRLVRGNVDLPIGGAPDTLHAVYGRPDGKGRLIGQAGDTLILMVRWDRAGKLSSGVVNQFGAATSVESSKHYNDQSPLFVECKLRPVWMDESAIRANLEREYRPGEE